MLVSGNGDAIRLWSLPDCRPLNTLYHRHIVLATSADGRLLASAGYDGVVRVWRLPGGEQFGALEGHSGIIVSLAFCPRGRFLASAGYDKTVRLWVAPDYKDSVTVVNHEATVRAVAVSADGCVLATAGDDKTIRLVNVGEVSAQ